jgi:hypothetical protein
MAKNDKKQQNKVEFKISDYELNDTDTNVFRLLTQYPEVTQNELARQLGITVAQFSKIKAKPAFRKAYNDFKDEESKTWLQVLIDARKKASLKLIEHIDSENVNASIRAIENVLQLDKLDLSQTEDEESPY